MLREHVSGLEGCGILMEVAVGHDESRGFSSGDHIFSYVYAWHGYGVGSEY